ncbi:hypothetical protein DPEC_G00162110, partial [Dallia pectoralis]
HAQTHNLQIYNQLVYRDKGSSYRFDTSEHRGCQCLYRRRRLLLLPARSLRRHLPTVAVCWGEEEDTTLDAKQRINVTYPPEFQTAQRDRDDRENESPAPSTYERSSLDQTGPRR